MEDLKILRERVRQRRAVFAQSDADYYQALQAFSLANQGTDGAGTAQEEIQKKRLDREEARFNLQAAINLLAQNETPQEQIRQIPADLPFLLLPVRVEARYVTFRHVVRNLKAEDCVEVGNLQGGEQFRMLGLEFDEERTPAYQVQALHLTNNSAIANAVRGQQLRPASNRYIQRKPDRQELCIRLYPDEIFTNGHERRLMPAEWEAGKSFWEKICAQTETEAAIWSNFSAAIPPARAAWIVRATRPVNYPPGGTLPVSPEFPDPPLLKDGAYTLPPVVHLLPDRFVVRLYKGAQFKEFTGQPIPEPLRLGLDPTDNPFDSPAQGALFAGEKAQLTAPEYLKWIHDLDIAENLGMAIRVDLQNHPEYQDGVDKIFVLGAKFSADETESARMLDEHLENCLYKEDGMAILPQGTPTNNFGDQKSGFNRREAASQAYFRSEWLPAQPHPFGLETDEMRLRRLVGLSGNFRLPGGHQTDTEEALRMNGLLWPATWGYYLLQFFTPALTEPKREMLRGFFTKYVSGRGILPVLRVNRQPYGILPTTAFSFWSYAENDPESVFLGKLWSDFISRLNTEWQAFSQVIQSAGNNETPNQRLDESFLKMLGQSASASRFQAQWLAGKGLKDLLTDLLAEVDADLNRIAQAETEYNAAHNLVIAKEAELRDINQEIVSLQAELFQVFGASKAALIRLINEAKKRAAAVNASLPGLRKKRDDLKRERDTLAANRPALQQARGELAIAYGGVYPADNLNKFLEQAGIKSNLFTSFGQIHAGFLQDLSRPAIDGLPLSEDRSAERLPGKAWNYLQWLLGARLTDIWDNNLSGAPAGDGPADSAAAVSLFALLTRQAILRALLETGLRSSETNPGLWLLKARDFDLEHLQPPHIQIDPNALDPNNRLHQQYKPVIDAYRAHLNTPFQLKSDRREYLSGLDQHNLGDWPGLDEVKTALELFSEMPTARLERLFAEHLDLCSHRLDAWMLGLVHHRLDKQRQAKPEGIHLGAFGYLLGLKPNAQRAIAIVEVQPEYLPANRENFAKAAIPVIHRAGALVWGIDLNKNPDRMFFYIGDHPNPRLRLNGPADRVEPEPDANFPNSDGYLHLPSLAHASAAAILRAGYLGHRKDTQTEVLSLHLNAPRVRQALQLLEGLQNGGALGEILGHYFERNLHEHQLDRYRFDLRQVFPLKPMEGAPGPTALMSSLDGLALLKAFLANPGGWLDQVPTKNAQGQPVPIPIADKQRLSTLAQSLEANYLDSTGDLLLAESIFQTTKGNTDRAAAALRALNSGGQTPPPEFVNTLQNGFGLTHRVGVLFGGAPPGNGGAVWTAAGSPRAGLAPGLNRWLARQLPPPANISISVTLPNGARTRMKATDLGIEPIDLLYACPASFRQGGLSSLALRVQLKARGLPEWAGTAADGPVDVDFTDRTGFAPAEISIYEISPLLASLRVLVGKSRALAPADFAQPGSGENGFFLTENLAAVLSAYSAPGNPMAALAQSLRQVAAELQHELSEPELNTAGWSLFEHLYQATLFGIEEAGAEGVVVLSPENLPLLVEKARKIAGELEGRLEKIPHQLPGIPIGFTELREIAQALFGRDIAVIPEFQPANAGRVKNGYENRALIENTSPDDLDNWLRDAALVRRPLAAFRQTILFRELFDAPDTGKTLIALQFPFHNDRPQPWIGGLLPENDLEKIRPEDRASLSLVLETPEEFEPEQAFSGILLDEWPELIPSGTANSGLAFQYNQPNSEPPQVILLATAPVESGHWQWDYLMGAVMDALDLSQKRLVAPEQIRRHEAFARVLPAITLPFLPGNDSIPATGLVAPTSAAGFQSNHGTQVDVATTRNRGANRRKGDPNPGGSNPTNPTNPTPARSKDQAGKNSN